ncbi:MAG: threonine synthase [Candidatus Marinimicrobia bacterium]|nr:threonine synthase [Candidatus Neomarinimicrobiota bacterium]
MVYICTACQQRNSKPPCPLGLCPCGKPLSVHYDWEGQARPVEVDSNESSLWRYKSVLPTVNERITLDEGKTPLVSIGNNIYVKDETVNPTGSFKDRGMALAVSMAKAQGIQNICLPSAGNAGISAAAYCQQADIQCHVFLPETIPESFKKETKRYEANIFLKGQTISDAAQEMVETKEPDWFDISTLKEPFRIEGKKTLGYEIAEQMGWTLPDVIIYPTGGGTGLIGMWKAFKEMKGMGWISGPLPRLVAAQSDGCAPVVKAFQAREKSTEFWDNSNTIALGLNVPGPLGGSWMLDVLSESGGIAMTAKELDLESATEEFRQSSDINSSAEAGVVWSVYHTLKDAGWIEQGEKIIMFATGIERG